MTIEKEVLMKYIPEIKQILNDGTQLHTDSKKDNEKKRRTARFSALDNTIVRLMTLQSSHSMAELQDSATDINPTGKNVAFMYTKDPEKFSLEIPLPFYQYPLQVQKLETEIPCETRTAGLIIYYPLSMLLAYGI